jgi:glycosyltransferase involved in cell wall biosynthesis
MKTCVIIPVYNHETTISNVITQLKPYRLDCFLVNDGSSEKCKLVLENIANQEANWIVLITRPKNGGKGAAVLDGFNAAIASGFTHAIQIDADGQHDLNDVERFLKESEKNPESMILGQPIFDNTAPKGRLYGRKITNFWIHINTLSNAIVDGMCGFRLYPLDAVAQLINTTQIGQRMDFDADIAVRLFWQGIKVINSPTKVNYPSDGLSHFRMWQDNWLISKSHARLFFGMLRRIPFLLWR